MKGKLIAVLCGVTLTATMPAVAPAQIDREQQVKAAYLYNFARFTTWPPSKLAHPEDPILFCIRHEDTLAPALHEALDGKMIDTHHAQVLEVPDVQAMRACHVAYLGKRPGLQLEAELRVLEDAEVVTVHEADTTLASGIVRLLIDENRLRFEINVAAAERSHIGLSARLLSVARVVRD